MQAIVLVGGEGTRLRPLTNDVPKPALTLVDRPFLAYMVEWLARHGVTEIVFACGFLPDVLRETLGDGERAGARLRYVVEPQRRGTAGAIRFAADSLGDSLEDRFLALNGDVLADLDLTALLRAHEERGATATLGLHPVEDSAAYGLVRSDEGGAVLEFLEKTGEPVPGEVNAGTYVLERSVLDLIPAGEEVSIEREVFPRLVGAGLHGLRLDGYWMDIGTRERYLQASWDILERRVQTEVRPTAPGLFVGAGTELSSGASVGPRAVIGPGCRVAAGAQVRSSVLLGDCEIGEGALVQNSVLAPGVAVASGAVLTDTIVGRDERVPAQNR
ncbi:MAG TPA: NDP-sugar synthase [Solirubrobacterales bacterium]|jgi:mannose-1-phosphate guanylyltransferase|nr:NDP-sugar synthase [Solirubrobacterales bacterium]